MIKEGPARNTYAIYFNCISYFEPRTNIYNLFIRRLKILNEKPTFSSYSEIPNKLLNVFNAAT